MKYACILGREYRLSLAELIHVFGYDAYREHNEMVAIFELESLPDNVLFSLGGTTRIIELREEITPDAFPTKVIAEIGAMIPHGSKLTFALSSFGIKMPLLEIGMRMKKTLAKSYQVRLANAKNENIHSAVFKKERLAKSQTEFALIQMGETVTFGRTVACQDIDAYARRDTGKNRDMTVGMMPPKLVQMMINMLSEDKKKYGIYDPFCGLGTTLIEALNQGIYTIVGSDISEDMMNNTLESVDDFIATESVWQEKIRSAGGSPNKDFREVSYDFFVLDATKIQKAFQEYEIPKNINIITEGYLGKIMRKDEVSQDAVFSERRYLTRLYDAFFAGLNSAQFSGEIVMSFPFWKVHNVYIYLEDIGEILQRHGFMIESLLPREPGLNTKNGSLLYRRDSQNVGREIMKIICKKSS